MKRQAILVIALLVSFTAFSQRTHKVMGWKISKDIPKNELKLNLANTVFLSYPEVSYERVIDSDISVGGSVGFALDPDILDIRFSMIPYFRWFFGGSAKNLQKYGAGFFIEANAAIIATDGYGYDYGYSDYGSSYHSNHSDSELGAGMGLAIGWKYLTQNNWVGEFYLGGGRNFSNDGAYPRFGISIGKRF